MEVDHFNPTLAGKARNAYENLYLASRHCNLSKRDIWPDKLAKLKGLRLLDCCKEQDYGVHIKEDSKTHELVGMTPEGKYHILICDLNSKHLVDERRERAELSDLLYRSRATLRAGVNHSNVISVIRALRKYLSDMIPYIPFV